MLTPAVLYHCEQVRLAGQQTRGFWPGRWGVGGPRFAESPWGANQLRWVGLKVEELIRIRVYLDLQLIFKDCLQVPEKVQAPKQRSNQDLRPGDPVKSNLFLILRSWMFVLILSGYLGSNLHQKRSSISGVWLSSLPTRLLGFECSVHQDHQVLQNIPRSR